MLQNAVLLGAYRPTDEGMGADGAIEADANEVRKEDRPASRWATPLVSD
jgi:hypothetical protein